MTLVLHRDDLRAKSRGRSIEHMGMQDFTLQIEEFFKADTVIYADGEVCKILKSRTTIVDAEIRVHIGDEMLKLFLKGHAPTFMGLSPELDKLIEEYLKSATPQPYNNI